MVYIMNRHGAVEGDRERRYEYFLAAQEAMWPYRVGVVADHVAPQEKALFKPILINYGFPLQNQRTSSLT